MAIQGKTDIDQLLAKSLKEIAVTATRAARDYRRRTETVDTEFVENEGDRDETDGI